jgi:hypothetical protein
VNAWCGDIEYDVVHWLVFGCVWYGNVWS